MSRLDLSNHSQQLRPDGEIRVISLISGKGGVGKTVLSFNLAERLSASGARVLLVDADMHFGNQHILANTRCDYGLREFFRRELSLKEAVTPLYPNLDLLAASLGEPWATESDNIKPVANMVTRLREHGDDYDLVVIDHGSGASRIASVLAHASDLALLVIVPELTSLSDAYGLYKILRAANGSLDCRLFANRVESTGEAVYIHTKFCALSERFLGHAPGFFGSVSEDPSFRESLRTQCLLSSLTSNSVAVQELTALGQRLFVEYGWLSGSTADRLTDLNATNKKTALADIRE